MKLLFGHDETVVRWLEAKMGDGLMPPWRGIGVIDDDGYLRAAHVLQPVTLWCAEWTLYSERAMTHGVVRAFFRHVFDDLSIYRLQIRTARNNRAIRRAAPKWGFKFECTAKGYWGPQGDAFVFHMTRDKCRWLKDAQANGKHLQGLAGSAGGGSAGIDGAAAVGRELAGA